MQGSDSILKKDPSFVYITRASAIILIIAFLFSIYKTISIYRKTIQFFLAIAFKCRSKLFPYKLRNNPANPTYLIPPHHALSEFAELKELQAYNKNKHLH